MSLSDDPIIQPLMEQIQVLVPGRKIGSNYDHHSLYPAITIDSCYHFHRLLLVDGNIVMFVQHKFRNNAHHGTRREDRFDYNLSDPDSLDRLFEDIERTSEHAP